MTAARVCEIALSVASFASIEEAERCLVGDGFAVIVDGCGRELGFALARIDRAEDGRFVAAPQRVRVVRKGRVELVRVYRDGACVATTRYVWSPYVAPDDTIETEPFEVKPRIG